MKQKFILERDDMEKLKKGEVISLAFAGGKIDLEADLGKRSYLVSPIDKAERESMRLQVLRHMEETKHPVKVREIADVLGLKSAQLYGVLTKLAKKKAVVNSDQGWRLVHETSAVKPVPVLASKNGHAKAHTNGR